MISFYRNGVQNSSIYNYTTAIDIQSLLIGQEDDCYGGCFALNQCTNAKLDEFSIYNRPLTTAEIANQCVGQIFAPQFSSSDSEVCEKFCVNYFDQSTNNPTAWQWIFPGGSPSSSTAQNPVNICYDVPGVYDVTLITTSAGSMDTLIYPNFITVNPTPSFPTITQTGYTLTCSTANSYQWQLNSVNIPGATNQSYTIQQTGYYTVVVGDSNGCSNSATTYILISGTDELNDDSNIMIYPNPSHGDFTLEFHNGTNDEVSIRVANMLGQTLFSAEEKNISLSSWKKEIDLSEMPGGVYFLVVNSGEASLKKKLIVDH